MLTSRKADGVLTSWKTNKRTADELPIKSKRNKRISNWGGETTESLISGDFHQGSNQCIWSEISKEVASNLSKSVVSLSLANGQEFACSGIGLQRVGNVTRFLTSASLARALIDKRLDHDNLKVEVRLGHDVVTGFLGEYDLDHEIAVVNVMSALDVHLVLSNNRVVPEPYCKVVALGHGFSGDVHVMATNGILTDDSSGELKLSTCKISKVYEGGALFDFGGNFLGMNFFRDTEGTFFLPARKILYWLMRFKPLQMIKLPHPNLFKAVRVGQRLRGEVCKSNSNQEVHGDVHDKDHFEDLGSLGYSKDLHYNVALVSVKGFHASHPAKIQHLWNDHSCDVVAVGYCFKSGKLMAARGKQFGRPPTLDCKYLCYSTCEITKAGIGGPLLDFDGRFFGMNFYEKIVGIPFLHWREILVVLEHFKTEGSAAKVDHSGEPPSRLLGWTMVEDRSIRPNRWPVPEPCWCHPDDPKIRSTGCLVYKNGRRELFL